MDVGRHGFQNQRGNPHLRLPPPENIIDLISDSEDSDSDIVELHNVINDDLFYGMSPAHLAPSEQRRPAQERQNIDDLPRLDPADHRNVDDAPENLVPAHMGAVEILDLREMNEDGPLPRDPPQDGENLRHEADRVNLDQPLDAMGDYILDDDFNEDVIARYLNSDEVMAQHLMNPGVAESTSAQSTEPPLEESVDQCISTLTAIFPGICIEYVAQIYETQGPSSDKLISFILDKVDKGTMWPKAKDSQQLKKRKRDIDEDEKAALKYDTADRIMGGSGPVTKGIRGFIRNVLREEFPETPMSFIDATMSQLGYRLFSGYQVLEEAERTYDPAKPPYNKVKRRQTNEFRPEKIASLLDAIGIPPDRVEVLEELVAARRIRAKATQKREAQRQAELDEEANTKQAQEEGLMKECGCCFDDYPLNRMVHCNGDDEHWFCRACALSNAENQVGTSRYELNCMSMDGCKAGFSMEQRSQFLNPTTVIALERNEQEAVLRMAGIENLASCPFCPYAAEYPPIDVNKEFECKRPDCEKVSCRLCNQESHIPMSCEEYAKETGLSIRREVEEAMTAALIRRCNKCQTPFIKEEGCNKMTCTRNGCYNIQCYVCSKSCGYDHFNDKTRGGKDGNCPLFENAEDRHGREVQEAERIALAKVRAEHPEYTDEDLRVKVSDDVKKDDERRKGNDPRARLEAMRGRVEDMRGRVEAIRGQVAQANAAVPGAPPIHFVQRNLEMDQALAALRQALPAQGRPNMHDNRHRDELIAMLPGPQHNLPAMADANRVMRQLIAQVNGANPFGIIAPQGANHQNQPALILQQQAQAQIARRAQIEAQRNRALGIAPIQNAAGAPPPQAPGAPRIQPIARMPGAPVRQDALLPEFGNVLHPERVVAQYLNPQDVLRERELQLARLRTREELLEAHRARAAAARVRAHAAQRAQARREAAIQRQQHGDHEVLELD